ncbi:MAG: hypothetical protein SFW09_22750 [Hyphomicrobiaceae bacterium]|nr:hypothetical protein [Hyphomicrobiaceae bacterium]
MPLPDTPVDPPAPSRDEDEDEDERRQQSAWWEIAFEVLSFGVGGVLDILASAAAFVVRVIAGAMSLVLESCSS